MAQEQMSGNNHHGGLTGKGRVAACHKCGNENPETFMFCATCGTRISRLCPWCKDVHPLSAPFCPRTEKPLPQDLPARTKGSKAPLAMAVGTLAIAGTMLLLSPTVQQETTYTYFAHSPGKSYTVPISRPRPSPTPTEVAILQPEHPSVCCYGVFYPEKCPKTAPIIKKVEKKDKKNVQRNQR
jgi:hypothetical protein